MRRSHPHAEWLGLMDIVGPFLTPTVLIDAFPNGLEGHQSDSFKRLRIAYAEWSETSEPAYHREWILFVLRDILGFQAGHILEDQAVPSTLQHLDRTHQVTTRPDMVLTLPEFPDRGRVLVMVLPKGESTSKPPISAKWQISPQSRMQLLLAATGEKLGVVTNGEEWTLVNACGTGAVGFATWYAYLWLEEQITHQSFRSLLGLRRVFGAEPGKRLADLLATSAEDQRDVTDRLGHQVRRAVEEFIGAVERIDRGSHREFLKSVPETEVYEGVLTVMMRLVFLFCAEERGLLRLGEELYDASYAVSTLREQLHDVASRHGEEVLERRYTGWSRLLATFRIVYQGVEHEDLRLPAYGGTLFDPDRYPWLEGRNDGGQADPPLIDDRIVLHLLDALQVLRERGGEARKLSFRALDVEQIGHVYEGLLDHTAKRAMHPVLGLVGKESDEPEVGLELIETKHGEGREKLIAFLKEETGKTDRALEQLLTQLPDPERLRKLRIACGDDDELFERCKPMASLIREDSFGHLQVFPVGALYCTAGSDRRSTGTHYTPRTLTEEVVKYALEPLVYGGPAEGLPEEEWKLKDAKAIVDLKVCDMAMGSGAFLVAACRYLSERLVEAWATAEDTAARGLGFSAEGLFYTHRIEGDHPAKQPGTYVTTPFGNVAIADPSEELIPRESDERLALARRIVADRCLYGVDRNAMAVEMGKLSLWLTTLRRDRPFTFLDHALRHGDSLLGVTERQLEMFSMDTSGQSEALLLPWVPEYVGNVRSLRQQIARIPSHDPEAIRRKQRLFDQVRELERPLKFAADAIVALELSSTFSTVPVDHTDLLTSLEEPLSLARSVNEFKELVGRPTFHWEMEFPDVFDLGGFDAIIGNPPFLYGTLATTALGEDYTALFPRRLSPWSGKADLSAAFVRVASTMVSTRGTVAMIATSAIAHGETHDSSLKPLVASGWTIFRAISLFRWPGTANVTASVMWLSRCVAREFYVLDGTAVAGISSHLTTAEDSMPDPYPLLSSLGSNMGVKLSATNLELATELHHRADYAHALRRAVGGAELYQLARIEANAPVCIDTEALTEDDLRKLNFEFGGSVATRITDNAPASRMRQTRARSKHSFACGETTRVHLAFLRVEESWLPTHKSYVFSGDDWSVFSVIQSCFHVIWAHAFGNRREEGLVYSARRCAATFPMLLAGDSDLSSAGETHHDTRRKFCESRNLGLSDAYHALNEPEDEEANVELLRETVRELDSAVAKAYGWDDIALDHGFYETPQGVRFTISSEARKEVLRRLLKLNHDRYAKEVAAGLHDKKSKSPSTGTKRGRKPNPNSIVAESRAGYNATGLTSAPRNLFDDQETLGEVEDA